MKNTILYRLSATIIDLAFWLFVISIFSYFLPDEGFLLGFVLLTFVFGFIEKKLSGKTIGQAVVGIETEKDDEKYKYNAMDKIIGTIAWIIPLTYIVQVFWIKPITNDNGWYDKTFKRKARIGKNSNSILAIPVSIILIISLSIVIYTYLFTM